MLMWVQQCPTPSELRVYLSPTLMRHSPSLSRHLLALGCTVTLRASVASCRQDLPRLRSIRQGSGPPPSHPGEPTCGSGSHNGEDLGAGRRLPGQTRW